jgi:hypothetical protein
MTDGCNHCGAALRDDVYYTEVNPQGGHGRDRYLVCDKCMQSGEWDDWKKRYWPNWPNEPRAEGDRK